MTLLQILNRDIIFDRDLLIWLWNLMGIKSEHVMAVMSYQYRHYKHNTIYTYLNDKKQIAL